MNKMKNNSLITLRVALGWLFFYAGITKVLNPDWSAAGYLSGAKTFTGLYEWLASPAILPVTNFLNQWGLTLIGLALILGLWTKASSYLGILLMALYYIPILDFPMAGSHSYLIDEHIIYILAFIVLIQFKAGNRCSLDSLFRKRRK
jgi:thiosulfate dehydrogenase (quinone) large subunit